MLSPEARPHPDFPLCTMSSWAFLQFSSELYLLGSEQSSLLSKRNPLSCPFLTLPFPSKIKGGAAAATDPLLAGLRGGVYFFALLRLKLERNEAAP